MTEKSQNRSEEAARKKREEVALRPYVVSLLSLFLLISMFAGTTLAWLTAEVSSSSAVITVGTVHADLIVDGVSMLENSQPPVFKAEDVWEPGTSISKNVTVKNTGGLKFDYKLYLDVTEDAANIIPLLNLRINDGEWTALTNVAETDSNGNVLYYVLVRGSELQPNGSESFTIALQIDPNANLSGYENQSLKFDIVLYAEQITN